MDHFNYKGGVLHAEDVNVEDIAAQVGTPFYIYSSATLQRHYDVFCEGLKSLNYQVCFAVKANSNCAVLATLGAQGAGADVVSEGEIRRALKANISPDKIVFSGVGKTREEMAYALDAGIFQFNVESAPELNALNEVATSKNMRAPIAIRINPDVDAGTHHKISTGQKDNKFGVSTHAARQLYASAGEMEGIHVQGVSMHIGSQLITLDPFKAAYTHAADVVRGLRDDGHAISVLDLGGGLGVPYDSGLTPPTPKEYGAMVKQTVGKLECKLVFEPGRLIVGNAGILVTKIIYVKYGDTRRFYIVDAAMNDLMRPAIYDA
ncbi:MAG: diaminopimelate decarboxylase, partial [Rickettsiales bacterium]|nr:diaminopimelate decarboxylase [Rickettsiales bacterium]